MKYRVENKNAVSDEELILAAKMGKQDAFNLLYERFLPVVYARVRFKVPVNDVEDVTQEIFIAVLRSLDNFRGQSKFGTWLRAIINRRIVDYYRSNQMTTIDHENYDEVAVNMSDGNDAVSNHDEVAGIQEALRQLPANYQDILLMRFVEGLSFVEISAQTGQSLEATKSLFRRAISALSQKLGKS